MDTLSSRSSTLMTITPVIQKTRMMFFIGFCLFMPFSIAYSQICLAVALAIFLWEVMYVGGHRVTTQDRKIYFTAGLFVLLCALSGAVNGTLLTSLLSLKEEWLFIIVPLAGFMLFTQVWNRALWWVFIVSVSLIAIYGWLQHFWGFDLRSDFILYQKPDGLFRAWGNFHNTLTYGNLFATLGLFFLAGSLRHKEKRWTVAFAITGALACGASLFSYSRGAMLGMVVGALVALFFLYRQSKRLALAFGVVGMTLLVLFNPGVIERFKERLPMELGQYATERERAGSRMMIWRTSLDVIIENPVFGVGPGNFADAYAEAADPSLVRVFTHAHNDVLNVAAYAGIPTALVFLALWWFVLRRLYLSAMKWNSDSGASSNEKSDALAVKKERFAQAIVVGAFVASITFFVCSLTEAVFADEEVRVGLMLIWGFGLKAVDSLQKSNSNYCA